MSETPASMTVTPNLSMSGLLEDVVRRVKVAGAVFLRGDFAAPWALRSTDQTTLAQVVAPGAKRLVLLHLAVQGSFRITLPTGEAALVAPGEAVVLPYCDVHDMGFPELAEPVPVVQLLPHPPWTELPVVARIDGGGETTQIMCGYLHCDDVLFDPILRALPRLIHLPTTSGAASHWREASLRYSLERAALRDTSAMSARIPEMVLVDCLLQYVLDPESIKAGWLAALADPLLCAALTRLHAAPAESWTVDRLARELAVSRSILADRFTETVGQPPMRYLAQWRLQLASDLLRTTGHSVAEIAERIGYESEAAFSRAFKRRFASAPAIWRKAQLV